MINLVNHFRHDDSHHSEWLRQRKWFIKARTDQEKREQIVEKLEDNLTAFSVDAIVATEIQIREFEIKLDNYEAATVTALMENQKQLDAIDARIEEMLNQAYVMEDGRRVFKTEDGTQVFDEFGQEVSPDDLDFGLISDDLPHWEDFQLSKEEQDRLLAERQEIQTYQQQLDDARESIADGEISQDELEELDAELLDMMPDAVRSNVPDLEISTRPDLTSSFKSSAAEPATIPKLDVSVPSLVQ